MAAESYRQMIRACANSGMAALVTESDIFVAPQDATNGFIGPIHVETHRLSVVRRFALLPHHDEVTP